MNKKLAPIVLYVSDKSFHMEIDLDAECWYCAGTGQGDDGIYISSDGTCKICRGRGRIMTDAGRAIYDVVERYRAGDVK